MMTRTLQKTYAHQQLVTETKLARWLALPSGWGAEWFSSLIYITSPAKKSSTTIHSSGNLTRAEWRKMAAEQVRTLRWYDRHYGFALDKPAKVCEPPAMKPKTSPNILVRVAKPAPVKPDPAIRSTGHQLGDPHPKSKVLNDWEGYTPLGDRLSNELDAELLKLARAFWRKHRGRIGRRDFKTIVFEAMEFRRHFPLADNGEEWKP